MYVKCTPVEPGEVALVTYCGLLEECKTFSKDSAQGSNLNDLARDAMVIGKQSNLYGGSLYVNGQDLLAKITPPDHLEQLNSLMGKSSYPGSAITEYSMLDSMSRFLSDPQNPLPYDTATSKNTANILEQLVKENEIKNPPAQPQPLREMLYYPPSWGLSYHPVQTLTDAYSPEEQSSAPSLQQPSPPAGNESEFARVSPSLLNAGLHFNQKEIIIEPESNYAASNPQPSFWKSMFATAKNLFGEVYRGVKFLFNP